MLPEMHAAATIKRLMLFLVALSKACPCPGSTKLCMQKHAQCQPEPELRKCMQQNKASTSSTTDANQEPKGHVAVPTHNILTQSPQNIQPTSRPKTLGRYSSSGRGYDTTMDLQLVRHVSIMLTAKPTPRLAMPLMRG
jgi:hypothetical protein